jgi:hypothetical protein
MKRLLIISAGLLGAVIILWIVAPFSIREMATISMEPAIRGQGSPPSRSGDYVLILTTFRFGAAKAGDLVLVEIPTPSGDVETIRRIVRIERSDNVRVFLEALDPLGIDSRHFGGLPEQKLKGKVLHVFRS